MKKLLMILLLLTLAAPLVGQQRVASTTTDKTSGRWEGSLLFYKKITSGADSLFAVNSDSAILNGASDSLYTDVYYTKAMQSIQLNIRCAGTLRLQVRVLCGNTGADFTAITMPDSLMQTFEWLEAGTGVSGNRVSTTQDSIVAECVTTPINLWCYECEIFQFLFITSPDQVGNVGIEGYVRQKEVY